MGRGGINNGSLQTADAPTTRTNLGITVIGTLNSPLTLANGGTNSPVANAVLNLSGATTISFSTGSNGTTLIAKAAGPGFAFTGAIGGTNITFTSGVNTSTCKMNAATTGAVGSYEFATNAVIVTGSDTSKAVCAASLQAKLAAPGAIGGTTPAVGNFTSLIIGSVGGVQFLAYSGSPNGVVTAPQGSWCTNIGTPSGLTDRVFINTDGGTTWTGITSVA